MAAFINGLILTIINLGSILFGFYIYFISKSDNQIAIQLTVACLTSVVGFLIWKFLCYKFLKKCDLKSKNQYTPTFFFSLLLTPVIFVPLHFFAEGYLTSIQNILSIWLFQIPTNIIILKIHHNFTTLTNLKEKLDKKTQQNEVRN